MTTKTVVVKSATSSGAATSAPTPSKKSAGDKADPDEDETYTYQYGWRCRRLFVRSLISFDARAQSTSTWKTRLAKARRSVRVQIRVCVSVLS